VLANFPPQIRHTGNLMLRAANHLAVMLVPERRLCRASRVLALITVTFFRFLTTLIHHFVWIDDHLSILGITIKKKLCEQQSALYFPLTSQCECAYYIAIERTGSAFIAALLAALLAAPLLCETIARAARWERKAGVGVKSALLIDTSKQTIKHTDSMSMIHW
jgi:hypothetical protein